MSAGIPATLTLSRASLLKLGAAAGVSLGAVGLAETLARPRLRPATAPTGQVPAYLRLERYLPLLGSTFLLRGEDRGAHTVTLEAVEPLPKAAGQTFSLLFRSSARERLGQFTYELSHPELGRFPLFLAPVGAPDGGLVLQAIVSHGVPGR